jgi:hypothetical protein
LGSGCRFPHQKQASETLPFQRFGRLATALKTLNQARFPDCLQPDVSILTGRTQIGLVRLTA